MAKFTAKEDVMLAILKEKKKLIRKAKKKGIWENFGQNEARKLTDKYPGEGMKILSFEIWCMELTDKDLA